MSDDEQEKRFQERMRDRTKRWKISPMDLEARRRWFDYSKAKDVMFAHTDVKDSPWWVVEADSKKSARLNCISHLLSQVAYEDVDPPVLELPPRGPADPDYQRPPKKSMRYVPEKF